MVWLARGLASRRSVCSATNCAFPSGVPRILIPSVRHTSSPKLSTLLGTVPLLFQTRVCNDSDTKSYKCLTLPNRPGMYTIFRRPTETETLPPERSEYRSRTATASEGHLVPLLLPASLSSVALRRRTNRTLKVLSTTTTRMGGGPSHWHSCQATHHGYAQHGGVGVDIGGCT